MQIVQPASNLHHRERMINMIDEEERTPSFYYALSHVWGISENNRHLWYEIGNYVDDEQGKPVEPVSMRPEKRDALLALLNDHPGSYWWIDVLCARTDTPLDIMGDIYSCCLECIVLADCEPSLIPRLSTMLDAQEDFSRFHCAHENISLEDLLPYKQLYDNKYPQLIELLYSLMQSEWWKRVWTWQEMALPVGGVRFMAETGIHPSRISTITVYDLGNFYNAVSIMNEYDRRLHKSKSKSDNECLDLNNTGV